MPEDRTSSLNSTPEAASAAGGEPLVIETLLMPVLAAIEDEPIPAEIDQVARDLEAALAANPEHAAKPN